MALSPLSLTDSDPFLGHFIYNLVAPQQMSEFVSTFGIVSILTIELTG